MNLIITKRRPRTIQVALLRDATVCAVAQTLTRPSSISVRHNAVANSQRCDQVASAFGS